MDLVQLPIPKDGHVAEWLRNGLQNRVPRFNSGRGLQHLAKSRSAASTKSQQKPAGAFCDLAGS
jgi:hypothetical protein